eukprot:TRINITY_DN65768_c0_g1_i1.p1 TRINITY_DN65768_c0_g1~~TRINITY_DN65768_c0_g1_i1.p1  ORF type:complete len:493 (-),score=106.43 TRINITY_DN65768_c0_g1_i1:42-1520(-)
MGCRDLCGGDGLLLAILISTGVVGVCIGSCFVVASASGHLRLDAKASVAGISLLLAVLIAALASLPFLVFTDKSKCTAANSQATENGTPVKESKPKESFAPSSSQAQAEAPPATPASPPRAPLSPRSEARELVGNRLNAEQAKNAAEKILGLRAYVSGGKTPALSEIWSFFDLPTPQAISFDPQDKVMQTLKAKLNRQRLLFHPDKNCHPEAEVTFKFLEVSYQRLVTSFSRRRSETVHQRTRREEEELKKEEERRRQQEEERKAQMAMIEKQEEERLRALEEEARRAEMERERLQAMLQAKQSSSEARKQKVGALSMTSTGPQSPARSPLASLNLFGNCTPSKNMLTGGDEEPDIADLCSASPSRAIGSLSVQLLRARDLPVQGVFMPSNTFATVEVGGQKFHSIRVQSCNPAWDCSFKFDVHRLDTSLCISVFREGWFEDIELGKLEIPFLDIEEWSGHPIGRVLEPVDPEAVASGHCMEVELRASFEWF